MPVKEADPKAKELTEAFATAMAGPAKPREVPPPPEVDRDAPHGRDADGQPLAPYGLTKEGRPKLTAAGRKAKPTGDEKARTTDAQPEAPKDTKPGKPELEPHDFSAPLMEAGETVWFGMSIAAKVGPQVPVLGKFIPGAKLAATAAVFDAERPRLAAALNLAAQHDARARKLAAKLAAGETQWALSVLFMTAPFVSTVAAVWQGDKALKKRELPALEELAKRNDAALDRMLAKISGQMQAAQQAAQQQALAQLQQQAAAEGLDVTAMGVNGQAVTAHA